MLEVLTPPPAAAPVRPCEPTPHPMLPLPTAAELLEFAAHLDGPEKLAAYLTARERAIARSIEDPYFYGFEFRNWKDADELAVLNIFTYVAGGKGAGKSEWAAKRISESALAYGASKIWCFQENETTSINTQQNLIWKYLPAKLKARNDERSPVFKIRYAEGRGFTERFLVLPNRTQIHFLTYNQKPEEFQGWELGARLTRLKTVRGKLVPVEFMEDAARARSIVESLRAEGDRIIPNLGAWADESLTTLWLQTLGMRLNRRGAHMLWTYSPLKGITTTIKEFRGTAKTLVSKVSELLPDRRNVHDCPPGHMPYLQKPAYNDAAIIYFFTEVNPHWGNYPGLKGQLTGKPSAKIAQDAYGYAEDTQARAFPLFGPWNIVRTEHLPAVGTNYMLTDPAGARNWATIWVRVTPGDPADLYIYREWPDRKRYGEWAVPSADPFKFDGDAGPAQNTLSYGVIEYKRLWLEEERITRSETDPCRRQLSERFEDSIKAGQPIHETVLMRYIDPRAGHNPHADQHGGTCLVDEFLDEQRDSRTGQLLGPAMPFELGSGVRTDFGKSAIEGLLYWDTDKPLTPLLNAPHLYVAEHCHQVSWALENWTGRDGEKGASKDFIDLLRYMALANLRHLTPDMLQTRGGGSY